MHLDLANFFADFGVKTVSKTDKDKAAYVVSKEQKRALAAAGHYPSSGSEKRIISVHVIGDPAISFLTASYYNSERDGSGRQPEARMGQGIIDWVNIGESLIIGNRGNEIFIAKNQATDFPNLGAFPASGADALDLRIFHKAMQAYGQPTSRQGTVTVFNRNPNVIMAALNRAAGQCEMPYCLNITFVREDGATRYLEVHHITPLVEGGHDTLINVAALCPTCHRELHYGFYKMDKRQLLATHIQGKHQPMWR